LLCAQAPKFDAPSMPKFDAPSAPSFSMPKFDASPSAHESNCRGASHSLIDVRTGPRYIVL
tara:strand:+ start:686 stop:868 length:183 start_codon:yes stop_codon:yes gene_type:complete